MDIARTDMQLKDMERCGELDVVTPQDSTLVPFFWSSQRYGERLAIDAQDSFGPMFKPRDTPADKQKPAIQSPWINNHQ